MKEQIRKSKVIWAWKTVVILLALMAPIFTSGQTFVKEYACDSYTSPSGKYTWFQSGIYYDTLTASSGADSVLRIHLEIGAIPTVSFTTVATTAGLVDHMAMDSDGNIYYTEFNKHRIQKRATDGTITTLAGSTQGSADGTGSAAQFSHPRGITIDNSNNLYVTEETGRITRVTLGGVVTTIAGGSGSGYKDTLALYAKFNNPRGIAVDDAGNLYIADYKNHRVRKISNTGIVTTLAGDGSTGYKDTLGVYAKIRDPFDLTLGDSGDIYVACYGDHRVRKITSAGWVTTIAGNGSKGNLDGIGTDARIQYGYGIAYINGRLYLSTQGVLRTISPDKNVKSIWGKPKVLNGYYKATGLVPVDDTTVLLCYNSTTRIRKMVLGQGDGTKNKVLYDTANVQYASPSGRYTWFRTGTYLDTLTTLYNCDSILEIRLVVYAAPATHVKEYACDSYTSPSGKYTWFQSGIYYDTLTASSGADSVLRIHLEIGAIPTVSFTTVATTAGLVDHMAMDSDGNIYYTEFNKHRIQKRATDGTITTLAGSTQGSADGTGSAAQFSHPRGITIDNSNNLYVTEETGRITRVTLGGVVTTIAGGSGSGYKDTLALYAKFNNPRGIAVDDAGNLYIADYKNHRVRKISNTGVVTTLAGDGSTGYKDTLGVYAKIRDPFDLTLGDSGDIYVACYSDHRVRKITSAGWVTTIAGNGSKGNLDGIGADARIQYGYGIAYINGRLYLSTQGVLRTISPDKNVKSIWGKPKVLNGYYKATGLVPVDDTTVLLCYNSTTRIRKMVLGQGDGSLAAKSSEVYDTVCDFRTSWSTGEKWFLSGTYYDTMPNLYNCDSFLKIHLTVKATPDVQVTTMTDYSGSYSAFGSSYDAVFDKAGNMFIVDRNGRILKMTPTGTVSVLAGSTSGYQDGVGTAAQFGTPAKIAIDSAGNLYVTEWTGSRGVRKITPSGTVTTLAGYGGYGYLDGPALTAEFRRANGIAVSSSGDVYITETLNHTIRKISTSGDVTTFAGSPIEGYKDGKDTAARFSNPSDLTFDDDGNLYVTDAGNGRIRKITPDGTVTTFSGIGVGLDDGADTTAKYYNLSGIDYDQGSGNFFVSESGGFVRIISNSGFTTTLTGNRYEGNEDGTPDVARFKLPVSMTIDPDGHLVVAQGSSGRLRKVLLNPGTATTMSTGDTSVYDTFISATGKLLTGSGQYADTLVNSIGCDSIVNVNLTVIHRMYVDSSASTGGDGMSWSTPFKTLTDALNSANNHNEHNAIFMRSGTYYPINHRDSSFEIINANVKIYGGFAGTEETPEERQSGGQPTILCGDIGKKGDASDNVYHVMIIRPDSSIADSSVILDGLTIQGGNANGNRGILYGGTRIYQTEGAGLAIVGKGLSGQELSPVISNCTFTGNHGEYASVFIQAENGVATPVIERCNFIGNTSKYGTIFNDGQGGDVSPVIRNCVFDANYSATSGGAIYNYAYFGKASPTVESCVFNNNEAHSHGGAIYNNGYGGTSSPSITNSTFHANKAGQQAGFMYNFGNSGTSAPIVRNSISSGNSVNGDTVHKFSEFYNYAAYPYVTYSAMQLSSSAYSSSTANSLNGGTNNLYQVVPGFLQGANPRGSDGLWRTGDDGLRLNARSSWVNTGDSNYSPETDILGNSRTGNPDMGAYEYVDCGLSVALATSVGTHTASYAVNDGNFTCYCNGDNELMLALDTNGSGAVISPSQVKLYIGNPSTISYDTSGGMISNPSGGVILERRWDVDPSVQPSSTVRVKYFYTNENYKDVVKAMANLSNPTTVSSPTELQFYKVKGGSSATFPNPHDSGVYGIVLVNGTSADTNVWVVGTHGVQDHSAEYLVTSFSGGGGGGGGGSAPLPVELIEFEARAAEQHTAQLQWRTGSELNNSHFVIERSYDGRNFEDITVVAGQGTKNTPTEYVFHDQSVNPENDVAFYRLKQVDFDGTTSYSPVRMIRFHATGEVARTLLFPNPTNGKVNLVLPNDEEIHVYKVLDNLGRELFSGLIEGQMYQINLEQVPTGLYFVSLDTGESFRVIKR